MREMSLVGEAAKKIEIQIDSRFEGKELAVAI